jgi:hypothetical protein
MCKLKRRRRCSLPRKLPVPGLGLPVIANRTHKRGEAFRGAGDFRAQLGRHIRSDKSTGAV